MITTRRELAQEWHKIEAQRLAIDKMECGEDQFNALLNLKVQENCDFNQCQMSMISGGTLTLFGMWGCEFVLNKDLRKDEYKLHATGGRIFDSVPSC